MTAERENERGNERAWLDADERGEHYLGLDGASIVATDALLATRDNLADVLAARATMCVHGAAGLGKTLSVHASLCALAPEDAVRVQFRALAGPPGDTTTGQLLETALEVTGFDAELVWAAAHVLEREEFLLGMEFGLRYPRNPDPTGIHDADVSAALAAGLTIRPLRDTLADTWAWLQREGDPAPRPDTPSPAQWFDPVREQQVLDIVRTL